MKIQLRIVILVFIAAFLFPQTALANRFVKCVQEQIQAAGFDAGGIDGQIGGKTRSGLREIVNMYPELENLPKLDSANAAAFCRKIGLAREAKDGWSAESRVIKLVPGSKIKPSDLTRFELIAKEVEAFYSNYGVAIPHFIPFVVSSSAEEAAALTQSKLRSQGSHSNIKKDFIDWCRGYGFCGKSYGGVVAMSYSPDEPLSSEVIRGLLSHELAHEIQAQYVGNYRNAPGGDARRVKVRGPKWLTEALAIALELEFKNRRRTLNYVLNRVKSQRTFKKSRLKSFQGQASSEEDDFKDYSTLAGLLLVSRSSHKAIFDFWDQTLVLGWQGAFKSAFGLSVEDFYSEIERL